MHRASAIASANMSGVHGEPKDSRSISSALDKSSSRTSGLAIQDIARCVCNEMTAPWSCYYLDLLFLDESRSGAAVLEFCPACSSSLIPQWWVSSYAADPELTLHQVSEHKQDEARVGRQPVEATDGWTP